MTSRWDKEYEQGAHWEKGRPSSQMRYFIKYLRSNYLILDAGCGSGRDSLFLAKKGYRVIGIDISKKAIRKARIYARNQKLNIQFDIGKLENLPYKDNQFDAVYSGYTLQHTKLEKISKELAHVLKKGKIAYIVMFEKTKYEKPLKEKDHEIDHNYILNTFKRFFKIRKKVVDEYIEEDQDGSHRHKRLVMVLEKL